MSRVINEKMSAATSCHFALIDRRTTEMARSREVKRRRRAIVQLGLREVRFFSFAGEQLEVVEVLRSGFVLAFDNNGRMKRIDPLDLVV